MKEMSGKEENIFANSSSILNAFLLFACRVFIDSSDEQIAKFRDPDKKQDFLYLLSRCQKLANIMVREDTIGMMFDC